MSSPSTPDEPWPVRTVARKIAEYIDRLGAVWVEGQLIKVYARPGTRTAFLTLRDTAANASLELTCPIDLVHAAEPPPADGSRVVVQAKPAFFMERGTLTLRVSEIRSVGIGELLARLERLRKLLEAEGLFDPRLKRSLPFLPHTVGLITGRASAAERDVVTNATARWPAVRFRLCSVATQGGLAVAQIVDALRALDRDPDVEVIVLARGGGSLEDLLPFSDETLCREVAACTTPVVSAIGHESDTPLLDHVADRRCSTPTDAGKSVVPDVAEESARLAQLRDRSRRALYGWVDRECGLLEALRSRPVLADPVRALDERSAVLTQLRDRADRSVLARLGSEADALRHLGARLASLGPAQTLARGYAVVSVPGGPVLRSVADAVPGTPLRVRLADGAFSAVVNRHE